MARLGKVDIFVESETPTYGVTVTEYPVEEGEPIADHVNRKLTSLALRGRIVGPDAADRITLLKQMMTRGDTLIYVGRNTFTNCVIESFITGHDYKIANGATFDMTIREIRKVKQLFPVKLDPRLASKVRPVTTAGRKQTANTKKGKKGGKGGAGGSSEKTYGGTVDTTVRTHTVRTGQTWVSIAAGYGISATKLRGANPQIGKYVRLKQGDILTIPA